MTVNIGRLGDLVPFWGVHTDLCTTAVYLKMYKFTCEKWIPQMVQFSCVYLQSTNIIEQSFTPAAASGIAQLLC